LIGKDTRRKRGFLTSTDGWCVLKDTWVLGPSGEPNREKGFPAKKKAQSREKKWELKE